MGIEIKIEGGRLSLVVHDYEGEFVPVGADWRLSSVAKEYGSALAAQRLSLILSARRSCRPKPRYGISSTGALQLALALEASAREADGLGRTPLRLVRLKAS